MMPIHKLGVVETTSTFVFFVCAKAFLAFPRIAMSMWGTAAWLVVLIGSVGGSLTVFTVLRICQRYQGKSLNEATELALGPVLGTAVNLAYFALYYMLTVAVLRQFSENIVATILPRTPLAMVILCLLGVAAYGVLLGIEAVTRVAWMMAPFTAVVFVVLLAGGFLTFSAPKSLMPIWGFGLAPTFGGGLIYSSIYAEMLVLGVIAPHFREAAQLRRVAWLSLGLSALILVGTLVGYEYVFPWPSGGRVAFPLLELARLIVSGRWVQRLESLFFLCWIIVASLKVTLGLYATSRTLADTMRLPNHRHVVMPLALTVFIVSQLPPNLTMAVSLDFEALRLWGGLISVGLPLLTWLVSLLRGKEQNHAS